MEMKDVKAVALGDKEVSQIADATGKVLWKKSSVEYKGLTFTAEQDNSTVKYVNNGSNAPDMQYSMDGENWQTWAADTDITLAKGESVYVRGDNASGFSSSVNDYTYFSIAGLIAASGDIMSLIDNGECNTLEIPNSYCFRRMFSYVYSRLTKVPELPATTLKPYCYHLMFHSCSGITKAPEIRATKIPESAMSNMFYENINLITPPTLTIESSSDDSLTSMFNGCSKLYVSATDGIPFFKLPADAIPSSQALYMLSGTQGGQPITPVANTQYYYQPADYAGLTFVAAEDGATVAYINVGGNSPDMKYSTDGTNWVQWAADTPIALNKGDYLCVKGDNAAGFSTDLDIDYTRFGIDKKVYSYGDVMALIDDGACATTEIPCNACFSGLFERCQTLLTPPTLPANTLNFNCYANMFYGCESLTIAPALPATELVAGCYYQMFVECYALTAPPELPASEAKTACYRGMFVRCTSLKISDSTGTQFMNITIPETATDAVDGMFMYTGGTYTADPVSGTDYYYE